MKKKLRLFLSIIMALALSTCVFASCGDNDGNGNGNGDGENSADTGWGDWWGEDWGDDLGTDENDGTYDPSKNYNTVDYSQEYAPYSVVAKDETSAGIFNPFMGVHRYEAENARLSGSAVISGNHVGYLDNADVEFDVDSGMACKVLLVAGFSTSPDSQYGHHFKDQYDLIINDQSVNTEDCWIKKTDGWNTFTDNAVAVIDLVAGDNDIVFSSIVGNSNIDYILLVPQKEMALPEFNAGGRIEAEATKVSGCNLEAGATGGNIGFSTENTKLEFVINLDETAPIQSTEMVLNGLILMTSGNSTKASNRLTLTINDTPVDLSNIYLNCVTEDGNWWEKPYSTSSLGNVNLQKGKNTVCLTLSEGINLDYIQICPTHTYSNGLKVEAEHTNYTNAQVETGNGITNLGFVDGNTKITLVINSQTATTTELIIRTLIHVEGEYSGNTAERFTLKVNGKSVSLSGKTLSGADSQGGDWWTKPYTDNSLGEISLIAGENVIEITLSSEMNVDYLLFN